MARKSLTGFDAQNQKVINVATGTVATDGVNLGQVQNLINGLEWKPHVRAASTTAITISAPGASIDGVAMAAGDAFLAKNNGDATGGVYIWNGASSAATRRSDYTGTIGNNSTVFVSEGATNADTAWTLTNDGTVTIGTTVLAYARVGAGNVYTQGTGIIINGSNVVSIDSTKVPSKYATSFGDGSSLTYTLTHNLGTTDVDSTFYIVATGEAVECDVTARTTTTITVGTGTAPATNSMRALIMG